MIEKHFICRLSTSKSVFGTLGRNPPFSKGSCFSFLQCQQRWWKCSQATFSINVDLIWVNKFCSLDQFVQVCVCEHVLSILSLQIHKRSSSFIIPFKYCVHSWGCLKQLQRALNHSVFTSSATWNCFPVVKNSDHSQPERVIASTNLGNKWIQSDFTSTHV